MSIEKDYSKDNLFDYVGMSRLRESYLMPFETSPQERYAYVAEVFGSNPEHSQRLYKYISNHWLSLSTPLLSYHKQRRGLPISCYLSWIDDSSEGLVESLAEICYLSMSGGGVGIGMGMRAADRKSTGVISHSKVYEHVSAAYRQGDTRRGSFATYLDDRHPELIQHIDMRKPTGDPKMRCPELHHGVNISDDFMRVIEASMYDDSLDDSWELRDTKTGNVVKTVSAKNLWERMLYTRVRTGEPYMHFIDASNRALPSFQKALGLRVRQSNICTEITLATDKDRTAVCCLSSLNADYYDLWKDDYQFYKDVAEMLDNALEIFIKNAPARVKRAVYSASRERSIGIGLLGFHSLLQSKDIPFESLAAKFLNKEIFSKMENYLGIANSELAEERGEAPDAQGYGKRFAHMMAVAPNASSSIIMGNTSPSIEPFRANGYRQDTLSGLFINKNKHLDRILQKACSTNAEAEELWHKIITRGRGSVQTVSSKYLSDEQKDIFKTFSEIDQMWIIEHAADRQPHIDQTQSINLAFKPNEYFAKVHDVHFAAWKKGLKTLYYIRSDKAFDGTTGMSPTPVYNRADFSEAGCLACE